MKKLFLYLLFLSSTAFAQSPFYNDFVRVNTLSPARVANALDVSKPLASTGTNTYTFSAPFTGFSYHTGDIYTLVFGNANSSTTVTANIATLGALAIKDASGADLAIGDLKAGGAYKFYNNGTHLRLMGASGAGGGGGATAAGATGNTQFKSAGGGLQAEAAYTYDSAANILTVPLVKITSGSPGANKVLTSDADGDGSWVTLTIAGIDAKYVDDRVSVSTAGGTITLDLNSQQKRTFTGSAAFATSKTLAWSNITNETKGTEFHFEITNVDGTLVMPSEVIMSDSRFDGTTWIATDTGKYLLFTSYDGTERKVGIKGPFN